MKTQIILDFDDFSLTNLPFEHLIPLKEHFPNLKVTLFTIPFDKNVLGRVPMEKMEEWAELIKKFDWIEIALHGFAHDYAEFDVPKKKAESLIRASENMMKGVTIKEKRKYIWFGPDWLSKKKKYLDLNIPYVKVFKAPRWQCSAEAYEVLRDRGYTVAVDRNQPRPNITGLPTYVYNWSIEEPFPSDFAVVKAHGHLRANMANDLDRCYQNLLKMPADAEFLTVSEYLTLNPPTIH